MPASLCVCGRTLKSRSGHSTHARKCPIERARSQAVIECVEQAIPAAGHNAHIERAVTAARAANPKTASAAQAVSEVEADHARLLDAAARALPSPSRADARDVLDAVLPLLADLLDPTGIPETLTTREVRRRILALSPSHSTWEV